MTSTSPSPSSSPSLIPPVSSNPNSVPPASQPEQATVSPPPPANPATSAPPLQLPPLPVVNSPPPVDTSPPPPDISPPPPDISPPPPDISPPPPDISPPPPAAPAPASPATTPPSPPPATTSPPDAPVLSPPPSGGPPPPDTTASPPSPTPPDPTPSTPSPPPPEIISSPPVSISPPPPQTNPPENSPPNQNPTPPPSTSTPPSNTSITPPVSTSSPPPLSTSPNSSTSSTPNVQLPTSRATDTSPTGRQNGTSGGSPSGPNRGAVVAISLVVGFVTLSLFILAVWFKRRQKKRNHHPYVSYIMPSPSASSQKSDSQFLKSQPSTHPLVGNPSLSPMYSPEHVSVGNSRAWFTYEELAEATDGFSGSNLLGEGGFGCVYKGILADGREVAVKQLKIGGGQGEREFRAEVEIIGRVHHRHLVSLLGYCISDHQRLLVYQYVPNNTLHYHLHGEGRPVMDWATRIKVAAGAARGLAYLHEDCHPRIIHRDIKSSNILLDENFDAQVADFGLAKLAMDWNTHVTTRVMGTFGYLAPEYASSGKLTEKSDVFSFGVVVLELITGRKPVDASQPLGDESLAQWARPLINRALETKDFEELVDPRLGKNYVQVEMFRMIEAAAACIRHLAPKRPKMSQVVRALDSIVEFTTDLSNGMKPGQSEIIDSREQSAQIRLFQRMAFGSQEDYSSEYFNDSQASWRS